MSKLSIAQFIQVFYPDYYQWYEYPVETCVPFSKVKEQWGILGNFAPTPLLVMDVEFINCEQLFQMLKFTDVETITAIHNSKGMKIKYAAKAAEKLGLRRPDWGQIIVDAMKFCLQTKFEQSEQFRQALKETTGKYIVEDQTSFNKKIADTWGAKLINGKYEGSNLLGRLLMELRDNGRLDYKLPSDIFAFINSIKVE